MRRQTHQPVTLRRVHRSRSFHAPDSLELTVAFIAIFAVIGLVPFYARHQIHMFEATEAVTLARSAIPDLIEYHAVHGDWPEGGIASQVLLNINQTSLEGYTQSLWVDAEGSVNAEVSLHAPATATDKTHQRLVASPVSGTLTFHPVVLGGTDWGAVVFMCGRARLPGQPRPMVGSTTLPDTDLPPACRGGAK
ncbi:MAG TPA: hypothetical protein VFK96_07325 [Gammaproteobacteria bacterium]|nr:hypothetical protein [Gammaproteobacteria bacterium]